MKKGFLIFLTILIAVGGYYGFKEINQPRLNLHQAVKQSLRFKKWIPFTPQGENFKAIFPQKPESSSRDLPIPGKTASLPYKEFSCQLEGDTLFLISYTVLPDEWLKYSKGLVLKGALKVLMKDLGDVRLIGKESTEFKSFPALDYEHHSQTTETAGTLVLVGKTLYKIEVSYPLELHGTMHNDLANFINHFNPQASSSSQSESSESDTPQSPQ